MYINDIKWNHLPSISFQRNIFPQRLNRGLSHFEPFWALEPNGWSVTKGLRLRALCRLHDRILPTTSQRMFKCHQKTPQIPKTKNYLWSCSSNMALNLCFVQRPKEPHGVFLVSVCLTPEHSRHSNGISIPISLVIWVAEAAEGSHLGHAWRTTGTAACPHDLRWTRLLQPGGIPWVATQLRPLVRLATAFPEPWGNRILGQRAIGCDRYETESSKYHSAYHVDSFRVLV